MLGGSAAAGKYATHRPISLGYGMVETCSGSEYMEQFEWHDFDHKPTTGGASLSYTREFSNRVRTSFSARVFGGSERVRPLSVNSSSRAQLSEERIGIGGAAVAATFDRRNVGATLGGIVGALPIEGESTTRVEPIVGLRVGSLQDLFAEVRLQDSEPLGFPAPRARLGIGHGLSQSGSNVRVGVWENGYYFGGALVTRNGLEMEPFAAIVLPDNESGSHFGISVRQRFGVRQPRP
ncbi:hypothetical protein BH23GEM6_BH23GEM6_26150 [soil metagenome]